MHRFGEKQHLCMSISAGVATTAAMMVFVRRGQWRPITKRVVQFLGWGRYWKLVLLLHICFIAMTTKVAYLEHGWATDKKESPVSLHSCSISTHEYAISKGSVSLAP